MPLNLDPLKVFIENEMVDEVVIVRDPEGYRDNTFDPITGQYTADSDPLYTGQALIVAISPVPSEQPEGGQTADYSMYNLYLPLSAPMLQKNDVIRVTSSMRDPLLPGEEFLAVSAEVSSVSVARAFYVQRRVLAGNV